MTTHSTLYNTFSIDCLYIWLNKLFIWLSKILFTVGSFTDSFIVSLLTHYDQFLLTSVTQCLPIASYEILLCKPPKCDKCRHVKSSYFSLKGKTGQTVIQFFSITLNSTLRTGVEH